MAFPLHGSALSMRFLLLPAALLALLVSPAHADEVGAAAPGSSPVPQLTAPAPSTGVRKVPIAVGVNFPLNWGSADSVAGSIYVGVTAQDAIRVNVASYANHSALVADLINVAAGGDGDEASRSGRTNDVGVGLVHYSRALWDGFTFELGALRRARNIRVSDEFASPAVVSTNTTTYAARALVGWSWLIHHHAFISVAAGMSSGYEYGTERTENDLGEMKTSAHVDRSNAAFEGYLRFGGAFDL